MAAILGGCSLEVGSSTSSSVSAVGCEDRNDKPAGLGDVRVANVRRQGR
jgi:hypothetical protein